ncbi:MAG: iron ABC transporter permease [bacterium]
MQKSKFVKILVISAIAVAVSALISLTAGGWPAPEIVKIRLMRILVAGICGFALAEAGVAFQMVFSNPLADPYLLGSSSGAALGTALLILFGIARTGVIYPLTAGLSSCLAVYIVLRISGKFLSRNTLILSGVALNFFLSALVILIITLKRKEAFSVLYFMMGDLSETNSSLIVTSAFITVVFSAGLFLNARVLNAVSFGHGLSRQLGIDFNKSSKNLLIIASLLVGAAVSISGTVGFVGLMAPHIARKFTGADARFLIISSGATGACLLICSDILARSILYPMEIPVGVITALVGAPYFIWLYGKR